MGCFEMAAETKRDKIISCLGIFPEKCELDLSIELVESHKEYELYSLYHNVEKDERIHSYLLKPTKNQDKYSAIVAIHQHAGEFHVGKSEVIGKTKNKMYSYGLDLCKRGYVVIVPDMLCFEERIADKYKKNIGDGAGYERFEFTSRITKGSSLQTKYLHDLSVAIDALETLSFVDTEKIGTIGHSLGGQEACWLTFYDSRIKVGVSSCGTSTMKAIYDEQINHNFAMYVPCLLEVCDMDEVIAEIAPKPFLMTSGINDGIFPMPGIEQIKAAVEKKYSELGYPELFKHIIFDGGHSFSDSEKEQAYAWLDRFLT